MACKHRKMIGNTTKYFVCGIKDKPVDDYICKGCPLKIEGNRNKINEIFAKIFGEKTKGGNS